MKYSFATFHQDEVSEYVPQSVRHSSDDSSLIAESLPLKCLAPSRSTSRKIKKKKKKKNR